MRAFPSGRPNNSMKLPEPGPERRLDAVRAAAEPFWTLANDFGMSSDHSRLTPGRRCDGFKTSSSGPGRSMGRCRKSLWGRQCVRQKPLGAASWRPPKGFWTMPRRPTGRVNPDRRGPAAADDHASTTPPTSSGKPDLEVSPPPSPARETFRKNNFGVFLRAQPPLQGVPDGQNCPQTRWITGGQLPHRLGMNCGHLGVIGAQRWDNLLTTSSSSTKRPRIFVIHPPFVHRLPTRLTCQKRGLSTVSTGAMTNAKQLNVGGG